MVKNKRNRLVLSDSFKKKLESTLGGRSINSSSNKIIKKINIKENKKKKPLVIEDNTNNNNININKKISQNNNEKEIILSNNNSKDLLDKNYKDNVIINNYVNYPENKSSFYIKICEIYFFISIGFFISKIISK